MHGEGLQTDQCWDTSSADQPRHGCIILIATLPLSSFPHSYYLILKIAVPTVGRQYPCQSGGRSEEQNYKENRELEVANSPVTGRVKFYFHQ